MCSLRLLRCRTEHLGSSISLRCKALRCGGSWVLVIPLVGRGRGSTESRLPVVQEGAILELVEPQTGTLWARKGGPGDPRFWLVRGLRKGKIPTGSRQTHFVEHPTELSNPSGTHSWNPWGSLLAFQHLDPLLARSEKRLRIVMALIVI